jgi:hypothetical protein
MNIVYLKDGTKANLVTKTEMGYVVDPFRSYHDYETKDEYEEPSGSIMLVDKVFESAPKEVVEEEYKQIRAKVEEQEKLLQEKMSEFNRAKIELSQTQTAKTNAAKMIINRSELKAAKRLTIWIKDQIAPRIMDVKNSLKLTISYDISQYQSTEKCWSYSCWSDTEERWSSYSEYFDSEYGIKADLTDEEIMAITLERQRKNVFDSHCIMRTDDKWLTPENLEKSNDMQEKRKQRDLIDAENELVKIQEKIDKLRAKSLQPQ